MSPFTSRPSESVAALGEARLIAAIRRWLGAASPRAPRGIGDDCAVLPPAREAQLITVDPVIYGRHFDARLPARAVGAKLLKRNLSDLAAMGGRPTAAVVALVLDARVRLAWLEGFYRGLAACARRHRVPIVGGDIAQADGALAASLTLLGTLAGPRAVTRAGGRPGDHFYVTGVLGGSLRSGHHHDFQPRLAEGAWLARRPEVRAMIDLSDGLAKDIRALTPPGAAPALFGAALPVRPGAGLSAALSEGEDYELAIAVAARADRAAFERAWKRAFPRTRLTWIGRLVRGGEVPPDALVLANYRGFEHLRRRDMNVAERLRAGIRTVTAEETRQVAAELAAMLPPDATLALHGDLGVGKTTFVQGLARGWGIAGPVTSPTYTIFTLHRGARLLVHLDAYRLDSPGQMEALILEEFLVSPYCLAVEWPEKIAAWLPPDAWHLGLGITPAGEHSIELRPPPS